MIQRKINRFTAAAFMIVILTGIGQSALAYTPGACRQDGDKLCPGLATDKELIPCLKQHEAELSTPCKVNLAEARQMVRDTKDACQPDIEKYCADVKVGQGRIRRCLKAHESELTPACQAQVAAMRKKYQIDASSPAASVPLTGTK